MPNTRYKIPKISETATLNIAADKTAQFDYNFNHTGGDVSVIGNGFGYSFFMPASSCTLASQQLAETFTGLKTLSFPSLATTSTDGLFITNATAATSGVPVQISPRLRFRGNAWDTDDNVSRTTDWIIENLPVSGTTVSSRLYFGYSLAGGSYTYPFYLDNAGNINTTANLKLPTTSSTAGQIQINGNRYFHAYSPVVADSNLFIGYNTGNFTMAGTGEQASYNFGIGIQTLYSLTTGRYNTAIGYKCLYTNQSGDYNVAVGHGALYSGTALSSNTAIGCQALANSSLNASNLTAVGYQSLLFNTTGTGLVAVGYQAGRQNVKGTNNTYVGYQAGYSGTTVVGSITITNGGTGYTAGNLIVDNTGTGGSGLAGTYTVDGSGTVNGITITNNGSGYNSAPVVTPQPGGSGAVLTPVLLSSDGNTSIGYQSLYSNISGYNNLAIGTYSLNHNTSGSYNTAIGRDSLYLNTSGYYNVAVGRDSLLSNTIGYGNSAMGIFSGYNNTSGLYNIYIGFQSAYKSGVIATGSGNIFMGYQTGINNTASYNMFLGYQAGYSNTTGTQLTYLGYQAGYNNTSSNGVYIGYMAGKYETGANKLFIDCLDRTNEATARTNSLIYGVFDATPANQILNVNGVLTALGYKSSDGTEGMTNTITFTDKDSKVNTLTIKMGLITAWTQA